MTLEEVEALVRQVFEKCTGHKPDVKCDGKRLVIEGLWSLSPKGRGWTLIRKYGIPEEAKPLLDPPRDYDYIPIWKTSKPLLDVLHALVTQFSHLRIDTVFNELRQDESRQNA